MTLFEFSSIWREKRMNVRFMLFFDFAWIWMDLHKYTWLPYHMQQLKQIVWLDTFIFTNDKPISQEAIVFIT